MKAKLMFIGLLHRTTILLRHCEPVRTLAWQCRGFWGILGNIPQI